jgi:hypothetical protein
MNIPSILACERCPEGALELWRGWVPRIIILPRFKKKLETLFNKILTKLEMERQEEEHQHFLESIRPHLDRIHPNPNGGHMPIVVGEGVMPRRLRHTPDS